MADLFGRTTKENIAKAGYTLLLENAIYDISVSDIIQEANISRRTFYNYFVDKYDLVTFIFDIIDHEYTRKFGQSVLDILEMDNITENLYMFKYKEFFLNTLCYTGQNSLLDYMANRWAVQYRIELQAKQQVEMLSDDLIAAIDSYTYGTTYVIYSMLKGIIPIPKKEIHYTSVSMPKIMYEALCQK